MIWTVSQLNAYVQMSLKEDPMLARLQIRGEISGYKLHSSGHMYFSLKDDQAVVRCVMFRGAAQQVPFRVHDGMRVVLTGNAGLYERDGQFQVYASSLAMDGVGALYLAFEALKKRLAAEGLFDEARKRPLPLVPRAVGVVTSSTGAALQDVLRVARSRHPGIPIVVSPTLVQGEGAAHSIARALDRVALERDVDVVIVGRGGGSMEDLWAFNEEEVARAIARCPVPVISAVGHETDTTIADFVADVRAATPSHAAQRAFPSREELLYAAQSLHGRLDAALAQSMGLRRLLLSREQARLQLLHPLAATKRAREQVRSYHERLSRDVRDVLDQARMRNESRREQLEALSPYRVLRRGYALVQRGEHILTSVADTAVGDTLSLQFADGSIDAGVQRVRGRAGGG